MTFLYSAHRMDELVCRLDRFEQKRRHAAITQKKTGMAMKASNNNNIGPAVQPNTVGTPKPIRPKNSCFQCGIVGHYRQDCPKRASVVATIDVDGAIDADPVDVFQTISVAFFIRGKCTDLRPIFLFSILVG